MRVRKVPTIQGETGDLGRTARLRSVLLNVIKEGSKKDINELTKVLVNVIPNVSTDMNLQQLLVYLKTVLRKEINTDSLSIPVEDSYTAKVQDYMSILDVNLSKNIKVLQQMNH